MGEVYRARDAKLGRDVAVKVLGIEAPASPATVRRFEQEARALSALNHPGIVTIHDVGECDGQFYIVMEIVEGTTLRHLLQRGRPRLKKALQIATQLADALAKAHEAGIVHRDLKPENVMLTGEGHVKIVDFGLARLAEPAAAGSHASDRTATDRSTERMLLGTVGYMSPEQAAGEIADFRADHFAFGAILYELATGARAFHLPTSVETLSMIIRGEPERPLAVNPALPSPVAWTIERCLSKNPADRYASTRDLARDVQTLRDHAADLDTPDSPRLAAGTRRSKLVVAGWIAVAAALGAGATAVYIASRPGPPGVVETASAPRFQQLTFRRGFIQNARFAPGGQAIIYAAGWDGAPVRLFETGRLGPESRPLGPSPAGLASISSAGELALIQGCRLDWASCVGTLATMPLGGGAPRDVLEDVVSADWTPDGRALAAIQVSDGEYRLQFPIGKSLYATPGRLGWVAFSPRGDRLAFVEFPLLSDESGVLKIVDLEGRATTLSSGWKTIRGVNWSAAGDEIWLSASDHGRRCSLYAVSLAGAVRLISHAPADVMLLDLSRDRRALLATTLHRAYMIWSSAGKDHELSWLDWSTVADLSADGKTVLFYEWGEGVGASPVVYSRKVDGSDAVRLGPGKALALSPDGRWALALQETSPPQLVLLNTGAGKSRPLPAEGLTDFYWAKWFPDGRRLLVVGSGADAVPRSYIQDTETGKLEAIADKGMLAALVSPDGRNILVGDPLGPYLMWPLDGGKPVPIETLRPEDRPIQWSADGRFLYLRGPDEAVLRIYRYNLATGRRELWKELAPRDPAGVIGVATGRGELAMTPDGRDYVFTYWTVLRNLFLAEGLPQ
jgi:Tol biopolymer transport system component/predicted Ser/Thr protein kinase